MMEHFATSGHIQNYFEKKYGEKYYDHGELLNHYEVESDKAAGIEKMTSVVSLDEWRTANRKLCRIMKGKF